MAIIRGDDTPVDPMLVVIWQALQAADETAHDIGDLKLMEMTSDACYALIRVNQRLQSVEAKNASRSATWMD